MKTNSRSEELRSILRPLMKVGKWYHMSDLMEMTMATQKELASAIQTWKKNGLLRKRGTNRTTEYKLLR